MYICAKCSYETTSKTNVFCPKCIEEGLQVPMFDKEWLEDDKTKKESQKNFKVCDYLYRNCKK